MKPWELQTLLAYLEYSSYRSTWQWHTYNARGASRGRWFATPYGKQVDIYAYALKMWGNV